MVEYKSHYACFECRKTFKRRLLWDIQRTSGEDKAAAKCPQCSHLMANMGMDFTAPRKDNLKKWAHLKTLYSVGINYHSCGCSGPGYIPANRDQLVAYFNEMLQSYRHSHLAASRQEPVIYQKDGIDTSYWIGRIQEIEDKLKSLQ